MNNIRPGYADEYGEVRRLDYGDLLALSRECQAEVGATALKPHFKLRAKSALPVVRIDDSTPVVMGALVPVLHHVAKTIGALRRRIDALEAERGV